MKELESAVIERLAVLFDDPLGLLASMNITPRPDQLTHLASAARDLANKIRTKRK